MLSNIPTTVRALMIHKAKCAAKKFVRHRRLSSDGYKDIQQELLVELVGRWPSYDPDRGTLGRYFNIIIQHKLSDIHSKIRREHQVIPFSLDEPAGEADGGTHREIIPESDGLGALFGQPFDKHAETEARLDVESGLSALNEPDRTFCRALAESGAAQLASNGYGARSTLYRRRQRIKRELMALKIGPNGTMPG